MGHSEAMQWVCIPGANGVDTWLAPDIPYFAGADDLASLPGFSGDPSRAAASVTFFPQSIDAPVPGWDGLAARFVYSPEATGMWALRMGVRGSDPVHLHRLR